MKKHRNKRHHDIVVGSSQWQVFEYRNFEGSSVVLKEGEYYDMSITPFGNNAMSSVRKVTSANMPRSDISDSDGVGKSNTLKRKYRYFDEIFIGCSWHCRTITNINTCHDSCAVVSCAKICSDTKMTAFYTSDETLIKMAAFSSLRPVVMLWRILKAIRAKRSHSLTPHQNHFIHAYRILVQSMLNEFI